MQGAQVVVDVSNSPSFEDEDVMEFFETSTRNLSPPRRRRGSRTTSRCRSSGRSACPTAATCARSRRQEKLIRDSGVPYSIVHATQFFEFVARIADAATEGDTVRIPHVLFQPIAADDVARAVGRTAVGAPLNGVVEIGGPEQFRFDEFIRDALAAKGDPRQVVADPDARYFGATLDRAHLVPGDGALAGRDPLRGLAAPARRCAVGAGRGRPCINPSS